MRRHFTYVNKRCQIIVCVCVCVCLCFCVCMCVCVCLCLCVCVSFLSRYIQMFTHNTAYSLQACQKVLHGRLAVPNNIVHRLLKAFSGIQTSTWTTPNRHRWLRSQAPGAGIRRSQLTAVRVLFSSATQSRMLSTWCGHSLPATRQIRWAF